MPMDGGLRGGDAGREDAVDLALDVRDLGKTFGGVKALDGLSFGIARGEVMGLIGPNGSGKSTTVNTLAGVFPATSGEIRLRGKPVHHLPEYARVQAGLTRTFQTASVFPEFTVREQVLLGAEPARTRRGVWSMLRSGARMEPELWGRLDEILQLTGLADLADTRIAEVSAADQRFLMIATALAADPAVILLDEPAAGMVSHERDRLSHLILALGARGHAVLVIEHHMSLIMKVCDRITVLNFGEKIAEGSPREIRSDQRVVDAYLGEAA